jgi:hypothetical protein
VSGGPSVPAAVAVDLERGEVRLGTRTVRLDPAGRPGWFRLPDGATVRGLTFAERARAAREALTADDPPRALAQALRALALAGPISPIADAVLLALAGGGEPAAGFGSCAVAAAQLRDWSWQALEEAPALEVDRSARTAAPGVDRATLAPPGPVDDGRQRFVFVSNGPEDLEALIADMAERLLARAVDRDARDEGPPAPVAVDAGGTAAGRVQTVAPPTFQAGPPHRPAGPPPHAAGRPWSGVRALPPGVARAGEPATATPWRPRAPGVAAARPARTPRAASEPTAAPAPAGTLATTATSAPAAAALSVIAPDPAAAPAAISPRSASWAGLAPGAPPSATAADPTPAGPADAPPAAVAAPPRHGPLPASPGLERMHARSGDHAWRADAATATVPPCLAARLPEDRIDALDLPWPAAATAAAPAPAVRFPEDWIDALGRALDAECDLRGLDA